jgi:hypothetical protein
MRRMKYPPQSLIEVWKRNFLRDSYKFTKTTHLKSEDYMAEFKDSSGETWQILGVIEGKEMPCLKVSTGDVHIWDRWQVSLIMYPEEHKRAERKIEYIYPEKKKVTRKKKTEETPITPEDSQLSLFKNEEEE